MTLSSFSGSQQRKNLSGTLKRRRRFWLHVRNPDAIFSQLCHAPRRRHLHLDASIRPKQRYPPLPLASSPADNSLSTPDGDPACRPIRRRRRWVGIGWNYLIEFGACSTCKSSVLLGASTVGVFPCSGPSRYVRSVCFLLAVYSSHLRIEQT